jgi:hypothetical protein
MPGNQRRDPIQGALPITSRLWEIQQAGLRKQMNWTQFITIQEAIEEKNLTTCFICG